MNKEKTSKNSSAGPKKPNRILAFLRADQTRFIVGSLFILVAALLLLAFMSFIVNAGKSDAAALEGGKIMTQGAGNWTGSLGAAAAAFCINEWLGVASFLYVFFIAHMGYRLMMHSKPLRPLFGEFIHIVLWSIWLSLFFGIVFVDSYQDTFLYLGGHHGYDMEQYLERCIGYPGLILCLVVSFIILLTFFYADTIAKTRSAFGLFDRWREQRAAKKAEQEEMKALAESTESESAEDNEPAVAALETPAVDELPEVETVSEGPLAEEPSDNLPEVETFTEEPLVEDTFAPVEEIDDLPEVETISEEPFEEEFPAEESSLEAGEEVAEETDSLDVVEDPDFSVTTNQTEVVDEAMQLPLEDYDPTKDLEYYQFPTFNLLKEYNASTPIDMEEQQANKERIKQTLSDYGIEIQSISATVGPTITLFEIVLVNGTKISRIKSLSDEIAMSIASKTGIRIIAPIPGKCAIGIEVPNKDPQTVSMRECIQSRAFQESRAALPVALGKTITNEVFTFDLAKAPHMLVAGATGQGKSVGLNAIITSLLYKKHPSQLKIVLVDPKMVEFAIYSRIDKHFLAKLPDAEDPIITDVSKVVETLKSLCAEMEDRYALLKEAGCRKLEEYNDKFIHRKLNPKKHIDAPLGSKQGTNHHYLPYIVAIVDEYGDLIMTAGKEVELPIARIAQKARAVGIHMIIATQRPSAKIVTGIIKANFPARIAFRVSSQIDSNIILDQSGAQNLIGRGDLFVSLGDRFERVQCAFVDTPEVDRINEFIADQQSYPTSYILPEPKPEPGEGGDAEGGSSTVDLNQLDPLFDECAELVVATGQGSTSMIQRKFGIGYNRAGRIMDQLEAAGIVGSYQGSKARAVLLTSDMELQNMLTDIHNRG